MSALAAELDAQKEACATVQKSQAPAAMPGPTAAPPQEITFKNVAEVVAKARTDFSKTLVFPDSAVKSAKESPYEHPERVYQLFQALDELVQKWKKDGKLGISWKAALRHKGFDYTDRVSMTSMGQYGDDYTFQYKGKKIAFENQVTLGAKQADSCLSVHWLRDETKKVLVIGSCGRHGTNTST